MIKKIILVGMMASGKSSVGKVLAENINWKFIDLDKEIINNEKKSIQEIFIQNSEKYFREIEHKMLEKYIQKKEMNVIATGGGTYIQEKVRELINKQNSKEKYILTIFLNVNQKELIKRLDKNEKEKRPLLNEEKWQEKFKNIYQNRKNIYKKADIEIIANKEIIDVVKEIKEKIIPKIPKIQNYSE